MCPNGNNLWLHKPWADALLLMVLWSPWKGFFGGRGVNIRLVPLSHVDHLRVMEKPRLGQTMGSEFRSYPSGSSLKLRIKAN